MGLLVVFFLISVVILLYNYIKSVVERCIERIRVIYLIGKIPGPVSLPLVGTTWQFKWKIEDLTDQLVQWQRYYQNIEKVDVVKIWLGPFPIVAMLSPKAAKSILESNDYLTKGDEYQIVERWLGTGLLTSKGDKWRSRRKLITPAFHFSMLNQYHQVQDEEAKILVDVLERYAVSGESFDAFPYVKRCALDIICATAMGIKVNAQTNVDHPYVGAVKQMNELSFAYSRMPWLWFKPVWYLSGFGYKYDRCLKMVTDFTRDVIKKRSEEFDSRIHDDTMNDKKRMAFLDLLLRVKQEGHLTNEDIREEVDTFMFEGHDTTSSGMAWTLWCLAHHPEYQQKVWEEVDSVFGNSSRPCTVDDLKKLCYLEQCIKESFRLYPPVPFFTRKLECDIECGGYTIPKNTTVLLSPGTLHTHKKSFSDPYTFDPENFKIENIHSRDAFSFIPFSAGPRNCIGQKFALMEEKTVLSWIFRIYEIRPTRDFPENCPCPEIILKPSLGLPITVHFRNKN
uniref:Cytochrome P450 n=1 Tax=Bursaphelenchus xylophilus TaxID=6326 RepID=A0A1I7SVN6_BURXY